MALAPACVYGRATMPAGIRCYGAYVPMTRLPLAALGAGPVREGGPEKAVAYYDEDSVTMAVSAAVDCLAGLDRACVDELIFASTSYPLREKQGAALIAKALDLRRDVRTTDTSGSLRAGTGALETALHTVTAGAARNVLVIASDCRMGAPRGALDAKLGDGAAAFLVGDESPIASFEASYAVVDELQDVWRHEGERFTHSWEDRFVVQEGYLPNASDVVKGLLEKSGRAPGDFARLALYGPDARALAGVAKRLGFAPEQIQDPLFGRLGNTGTAFAPMLLVGALEQARPGERLLCVSYGDGAHALSFVTTEHLEKLEPRRGLAWHLARRRTLPGYDSYLRSRGLAPGEWEAGADLGLSATVRFRERDADIGFLGARCGGCGLIHFPRQRVCYRCHRKDDFAPVRLSDRTGTLLAYTFDHFFPAADPPTIVIMTEVDGCRIQVQLADARPDDVHLDMSVEFVFRKIHEAGGKPNYFWKASPLLQGDPV